MLGISKYFQSDHQLLVRVRDAFASERGRDMLWVGSRHRTGVCLVPSSVGWNTAVDVAHRAIRKRKKAHERSGRG